ncbi:MAG: tetraacyldisaccharide 4'-kinase [Smithella sp.]
MQKTDNWQRIWNDDGGSSRYAPAKTILYAISLPYRLIINLRNWLYDHKIFREIKLSSPVISVGNITAGGTGKTPCVIWLARMLKENGFRPVILSRGYGGKSSQPVNIVSDGKDILLSNIMAGDEPYLIARTLPDIPVITGPKRVLTGKTAIEKFGADVLICDDAFQHRQIFRDINLVLLDSGKPLGNGHLLPRGILREPPSALHRADAFILTRSKKEETFEKLPLASLRGAKRRGNRTRGCNPLFCYRLLHFVRNDTCAVFQKSQETTRTINGLGQINNIPVFRSSHQPVGLVSGDYTRQLTLTQLKGKRVHAFSGIAKPDSFEKAIADAGAKITAFDIFPDHHHYTTRELENIRHNFLKDKADLLITTEKDGMRLQEFTNFLSDIYLLCITMEIIPDENALKKFILKKLGKKQAED